MEQIIGKLSEIETTAETIMRDALQKLSLIHISEPTRH